MAEATPIIAPCPQEYPTRRRVLLALPLVAALAVPALASINPDRTEREQLIRVIDELEAWQGWEPSATAAAKAFAAWQVRKALGLELPAPRLAQMHIDYQRQRFEDYRRSDWAASDRDAGRSYEISPMERSLA